MSEDMLYNGTTLHWYGFGAFKATSGAKTHQNAAKQAEKDFGPIPEGRYWFPVLLAKQGRLINSKELDKDQGIQSLPDTFMYRDRFFISGLWGADRVRLNVTHIDDPAARKRDGFYLHDSRKGYSHGCIEVDPLFFGRLRTYYTIPHKGFLHLRVKYPSATASTNADRLEAKSRSQNPACGGRLHA